MGALQDKLDELTEAVETARAMPLSSSCVLNRPEVLATLEELRALLPTEIASAQELVDDRASVVESGRREAARILAEAKAERARLVSRTEIVREAGVRAQAVVAAAQVEADAMRHEVEDYIDGKLATFEVVLTKTLGTVERGRERLRGRLDSDSLAEVPEPLDPLPGDERVGASR